MTITDDLTLADLPPAAERAKLEGTRGLTVDTKRDFVISDLEVRAAQDDSPFREFVGHASITGKPYEMYGGPEKGGWNETVAKGAFKRTLSNKPDVPFKINHEGMTLARTTAGNLTLEEDQDGLAVRALLDTRVSIVNDLVYLMEGGNIDEMSFAFRVRKQTWRDAEGEEVPWWDLTGIDRSLDEVDIHKGDVSVVNYGANPFTDAQLRSLDETLRGLVASDADPEEIRAAIDYLETLLPAPSVHPDLVAAQQAAVIRLADLRA